MSNKLSKSQRTKKIIMDTAIKLFSEKGFAESTMREIAQESGLALGSFYYHFKSKEEIVLELYQETQKEDREQFDLIKSSGLSFEDLCYEVIYFKVKYLKPYRKFLGLLLNPNNALSPFAKDTQHIRLESIAIYREIVELSKVKVSKDLKEFVPTLLWFFQMAIIFFWIHDESEEQKRTLRILRIGTQIVEKLLALSRLPGVGTVKKSLMKLLREELFFQGETNEIY